MQRRLLTAIGLSTTLLLVSCADDQARSQLATINSQVSQLQETVSVIGTKVSTQKLVDILNKLDDLQNQINELNGNVNTLKQNQQDYKVAGEQLHQSLEQQVQALQQKESESSPQHPRRQEGASSPVVATTTATTDSGGPLKVALKKIKARNFPQAIKDLKNIISTSDDSAAVTNASYYLSVAYAANGQYKDAMLIARKFIKDNSDNSNIPDALRVVYIAQTQLGMKKSAAKTATQLISQYPNSEAAKKVREE